MPKIMEILGYIIYFWSNEGTPLEALHVHIAHKPQLIIMVLLKKNGKGSLRLIN